MGIAALSFAGIKVFIGDLDQRFHIVCLGAVRQAKGHGNVDADAVVAGIQTAGLGFELFQLGSGFLNGEPFVDEQKFFTAPAEDKALMLHMLLETIG